MNNNEFVTLTGEDREAIEQTHGPLDNCQVKEFVDKDGNVRRRFYIDIGELSPEKSDKFMDALKEKFANLKK